MLNGHSPSSASRGKARPRTRTRLRSFALCLIIVSPFQRSQGSYHSKTGFGGEDRPSVSGGSASRSRLLIFFSICLIVIFTISGRPGGCRTQIEYADTEESFRNQVQRGCPGCVPRGRPRG